MQFDIIIPHYGVKHLTQYCLSCLKSIRTHSSDYRVIIINNGSPEFGRIEEELDQHKCVRVLHNETNQGFIKATNQGILEAKAPYIVLLNNDTVVVENWLDKLKAPLLYDKENIGLSGPRSSSFGSWQGRIPKGRGWEILPVNSMLAFFCTMFKAEVFVKVGLLDEAFGVGFGDDDHYCWKAQKAGYNLALVKDLEIEHHHRSTFFELYGHEAVREMQTKALDLFRSKIQDA